MAGRTRLGALLDRVRGWLGLARPGRAGTVVVVHGLGRTSASMSLLSSRLRRAGFRVVSFGYPSTREPIDALVERLAGAVGRCCPDVADSVHFVTHSMGGMLVRCYLAERSATYRGHVVMLAPPSQGSELIDALGGFPLVRAVVGPAGVELGTDPGGIASRLGPADFSLGVITGDRNLNPLSALLIPGPSDGKVAVERARVEGQADFLVVDATHTFIMNRRDVARQVVHFLRHGRFR